MDPAAELYSRFNLYVYYNAIYMSPLKGLYTFGLQ